MQSKSIIIEKGQVQDNTIAKADYCLIKKSYFISLEAAPIVSFETSIYLTVGLGGLIVIIFLIGCIVYRRTKENWKPL